MIITIDGPAGSGKSTAARELARRLKIPYLDTGAMYRGLAYAAWRHGLDFSHEKALTAFAREATLTAICQAERTLVRVNGEDVTDGLRDHRVSELTPHLARIQAIRDILVGHQRRIGEELASLVTEGRDQGSVVFPHADLRVVLDASLERRAQRRFEEIGADHGVTLAEVRQNLAKRDQMDCRHWQPLVGDPSVFQLNTTNLSLTAVVEELEARALRLKTGDGILDVRTSDQGLRISGLSRETSRATESLREDEVA